MTDPRLRELSNYLTQTDRSVPHAVFWVGWANIAGDLCEHVWAADVTPELREAYTELLAEADERGWMVPLDQCQPCAGSSTDQLD